MKRLTPERLDVLECLRTNGRPMRVGEIAIFLGKKRPNTSLLIGKLYDAGLIESPRHGWYRLPTDNAKTVTQVSEGIG